MAAPRTARLGTLWWLQVSAGACWAKPQSSTLTYLGQADLCCAQAQARHICVQQGHQHLPKVRLRLHSR